MTATAVLVGAGAGERLGAGVPKALATLGGRPLLVWSALALAGSGGFASLVVVCTPGYEDQTRHALDGAGIDAVVCTGGTTRQESVSRGLAACAPGTTVVAVHDAARPLLGEELVRRVLGALAEPWDAVAPGLPVVDTLKLVEPARHAVLRTVDRRGLWSVQTPQVFRRSTLEAVHARVATSADAATDDLALVERAGGRVRLVEGERRNFKVTYPDDLRLAEQLLPHAT